MEYLSLVIYFVLAWITILLLTTAKANNTSNPRILPPGPRPLPIFGNLFSLGNKPHISLTELAKTYGPLMLLQLGQVPTVIISSAAMAKEALQKNDVFISSRHVVDAVRALDHHKKSLAWLPPASDWRNLRKICNSQVFSTGRLNASQHLRSDKVKDLLSYVETCSEAGVAVHLAQAAFSTTLNLLSTNLFSMDMGDPTSEFSHKFKDTIRSALEEVGKPNFADFFPILRKIDPQGIRRRSKVHMQKMIGLFQSFVDQRLQGVMPSGSVQENDVLDALLGINHVKTEEIEKSRIAFLLMDLITAGTDSTSTTLEWAMTELLRNPKKMKEAQAELRGVIGRGNSLQESDINQLPYLQSIIKETFRLHPAAPLLLPRKVDSDVKLFEFTVPKNTQVLVNVWAIGRDPDIWQNPNLFEPERFLGSDIDVKGHSFELIPFGAGRRICPGLPLATRMLHLMLGSLLHGFDWKLEDGVEPENMDMEEKFGLTLEKAQPLRAIPIRI